MSDNSAALTTHSPSAVATQLAAKLASHSRHVCLLFGAGTSCAAGLPDVKTLLADVLQALSGEAKSRAEHLYDGRSLEEGLTRLRRIRALLVGEETFDGLTASTAEDLEKAIVSAVITRLSATDLDLTPATNFATWASGEFYSRPIEVFTVNYDLLLERGLEAVGASYFDGFVGSVAARFREDMIDPGRRSDGVTLPPSFVRLWKLHGSLNWENAADGRVVRKGVPAVQGGTAAIYPSDEKYDQSRRVPFVVLHDRFRHALAEPETLSLIAGYSFGDDHLNEVIFDAARRYPRSEIVALFRSAIPSVLDKIVVPNLTVLAAEEAIIGGQRRAWAEPARQDVAPLVWDKDKFRLGDFRVFSQFIAQVSRGAGDTTLAGVDLDGV